MIKKIKVILNKKIYTGGLEFTVIEMIDNPVGFPLEKSIADATVKITQNGNLIHKGYTGIDGILLLDQIPIGPYNWSVDLEGYNLKSGTETVEA